LRTEVPYTSALKLRGAIAHKQLSAVEVMEQTLARMESVEPAIGAFVTTTFDEAMEAARAADAALSKGWAPGALHGLPISVKDGIDVAGVRTTHGSLTTPNGPASADAIAVERIRAAGACVIGKTNTTEFGLKAGGGDSPVAGVTRNPWDVSKTPGGSSTGAAASVAAGVTPFALGTDGGGSIRIPASFCGVFGIKAQFGRVPLFPPDVSMLGHHAPVARTVRDAAMLLGAIAGLDARDPFSVTGPVPNFLSTCDEPVEGMRVAWSPTLGYAKPAPEVVDIALDAVRVFESLGCEVDLVDEVMGNPIDLWNAEVLVGASYELAEVMERSRDLLDPAVAEYLDGATEQTVRDYASKRRGRNELREEVRHLFENNDLLLTPTLPVPPFSAGRNVPEELSDRGLISWAYYTYPFNLTGNPAASVPCGFTEDGLPVGLQIVAGNHREGNVLRAAATLEEERPWTRFRPEIQAS
jgi:Asp-tRNA(Asn)/Glu-tRNA(Gln) amidotransferase A subunit family amidase